MDVIKFKDISEDISKDIELFIPLWTNVTLSICILAFSAVYEMLKNGKNFSIKFEKVLGTFSTIFVLGIIIPLFFAYVFKTKNIILEFNSKITLIAAHSYSMIFLVLLSPLIGIPWLISRLAFYILSYTLSTKSLLLLYKSQIKRL